VPYIAEVLAGVIVLLLGAVVKNQYKILAHHEKHKGDIENLIKANDSLAAVIKNHVAEQTSILTQVTETRNDLRQIGKRIK